jgi:predicted site-specific integrase-resolvase
LTYRIIPYDLYLVKLADWARAHGIDYKTAYRGFRVGILPIPSIQLPTGTILVTPEAEASSTGVALYGRVSSSGQRKDLDRQMARLVEYASAKKLPVTKAVREIGSGLNGRRKKLMSLLKDAKTGTIIVEHRDRLARFGVELVEAALAAVGRRIEVVDAKEMKDDLVRDMVDVLTSMCARLYGKRSAKRRAERAMKAIQS